MHAGRISLHLVLPLAVFLPAAARAQSAPPDDGHLLFGAVGLARGQVARLTVTLAAPQEGCPAGGRPRVIAAFAGAAGAPLADRAGNPVRAEFELRDGETRWLDLDAREVLRDDQLRVQIRPLVVIEPLPDDDSPPPDDDTRTPDDAVPPDPCRQVVAALELLGGLAGRTEAIYANPRVEPPPDDSQPPDDGSPPPDDTEPPPDNGRFLFGSVGLARGEVARVSVALATPPGLPAGGIRPGATIAFCDAAGAPFRDRAGNLIRRRFELADGQTVFLDLDAREVLGDRDLRVQIRPVVSVTDLPPDPFRPVIPTLEVFARLTGRTQILAADPRFEATPPPEVAFPSREFPTLEAAIAAVPDGGVLRIAAGAHAVEPLFIRSKSIAIRGPAARDGRRAVLSARRPERVLPMDETLGVFNFIDAGGSVEDLEISGGDAAIVTRGSGAPSLRVAGCVLARNGRGLLARGTANIDIENVAIHNPLGNGISVAAALPMEFPLLVNIQGLFLLDPGAAGIFVNDGIYIGSQVTVLGAPGGGLLAVNSGVFIDEHYLIANTLFGILLDQSSGIIQESLVAQTLPRPSDGSFGDGIVLVRSPGINILDNEVENSARAAVSLFGSSAFLDANEFVCQVFDLDLETYLGQGSSADEPSELANLCGCPWTNLGNCQAVSSQLVPPEYLGDQ